MLVIVLDDGQSFLGYLKTLHLHTNIQTDMIMIIMKKKEKRVQKEE